MTRTCRVLLLSAWLGTVARGLESFEDGQSVSGWSADAGDVSVSEAHWKLGSRSLRWRFAPRAELIRTDDEVLRQALASRVGGVKLWLYCEEPVTGQLQFRAGPWAFPVNLGFTGWRALWVLFREDAQQSAPVHGMRLVAPDASGTLFLDAVELGDVPWQRQGDAQAPYTNARRANGTYWMTTHDWSATPPPPPAGEVTPADRAAFRMVERRYEQWMFGGIEDQRDPVRARLEAVGIYIRSGREAFGKLGLTRRGDKVCGPGAFGGQDRHKPDLASDIFQPIALPLAYDARLNGSEQARQRFLDLTDYACDQGWAAGSLMGSGYGGQLRISSYVHAVYILRDILRKRGRLDRELATLRYHLELGQMYGALEHPGANADDLRTRFLFRLLYVLMQSDSAEKVRDMQCLVRWANLALSVAPGYGDTIKPDGTVFHHATAYASAYGNNAMHMSALVYWLLHDTPFALSAEAGENLKRALLTLRFMAGKYHFPMGVSGRWPFSGPAMYETMPAFAYLSDALDDAELAAAFARLWDPRAPGFARLVRACGARIYWAHSPGALPWLLDVAKRHEAEPDPTGHRVYPYAAMSVHRRRQWVASVRGWSKYVWNYEAHTTQNRYGRYSSYGMIQIFSRGDPVSREDSGYREPGWDWLRPPGATVIRVDLDALGSSTVIPRQYTTDPFVGGVSLDHRNGLWAMRFDDPYYETSFRFRKSVFFVDDTLLCLGSGICNDDDAHPTETVLYQTALSARPEPFPQSFSQRGGWLLDPVGNGYLLPGDQSVEVRRQHQASVRNNGKQKSEGDVAVAWLEHGVAPRNAGYVYAIRPDTTADTMARYASDPDFVVVQRDDAAHIVRFPTHGLTGYVLFARTDGLGTGELRGADAPCLVVTRRDGDTLHLAVCDPDLRLPTLTPRTRYQPGGEGRLQLRLEAGWRVLSAPDNVRVTGPGTLTVHCRDGATYAVRLARQ